MQCFWHLVFDHVLITWCIRWVPSLPVTNGTYHFVQYRLSQRLLKYALYQLNSYVFTEGIGVPCSAKISQISFKPPSSQKFTTCVYTCTHSSWTVKGFSEPKPEKLYLHKFGAVLYVYDARIVWVLIYAYLMTRICVLNSVVSVKRVLHTFSTACAGLQ